MDDAERNRKELDLIFQELDEKEQLKRQSESLPYQEFIAVYSYARPYRTFSKVLSTEKQAEVLDACWKAKIDYDKKSGTQI